MHIFEGRGKGATTTMLLETLRNTGIYVTSSEGHKRVVIGIVQEIYNSGELSRDGYLYLKSNIYSINENLRGVRKPVYLDMGLDTMRDFFVSKFGSEPKIIALGNDREQLVNPRHYVDTHNDEIRHNKEGK